VALAGTKDSCSVGPCGRSYGGAEELNCRTIAGLTHSTMEILLNHAYSGNVQELQNIIEHALILCSFEVAGSISVASRVRS
jgi:DNA-binding NtrC family response regulator